MIISKKRFKEEVQKELEAEHRSRKVYELEEKIWRLESRIDRLEEKSKITEVQIPSKF